jgi:hypothetical protein
MVCWQSFAVKGFWAYWVKFKVCVIITVAMVILLRVLSLCDNIYDYVFTALISRHS